MPAKNGVDGTLYTYPNNPRASLIQISAQYGSSDVKLASGFEFGVTNLSADFTAKFPFGKVPAFESSEGCLFDTMAIASLVGGPAMRGSDEFTRAQITQWMNVAELELFPNACQVLYPCWGLMPNNKNVVNKAKENLKGFMTALNQLIESRTYLVGEQVTLADLTLAMYMRDLYMSIFDAPQRETFGNVTRWFNTIMAQSEVVRVVGQTALCEKPAQFDAKLFAANHPKTPKQAAPKKEQAPKAEAKKEAAAEAPKPPPKKKPFSHLPAPKLCLDTFKRMYWNDSTEEIMKYFDENFVEGEYSVWRVDYKYNDELTKIFMTNNLVKGMMQRLETFRNFAFGLMYIFGKNDANEIHGVWLGRGAGNPFYEDENWQTDIESYDCAKLDMSNPQDKALFVKWLSAGFDDWNGNVFYEDHIF